MQNRVAKAEVRVASLSKERKELHRQMRRDE